MNQSEYKARLPKDGIKRCGDCGAELLVLGNREEVAWSILEFECPVCKSRLAVHVVEDYTAADGDGYYFEDKGGLAQ